MSSLIDKLKSASAAVRKDVKSDNTYNQEDKLAWSDLVEMYPDKWIIYTDVEIVKDDRLFLCKVLEVCDDNMRSERKLYYLKNGIKAIATRTTSSFNGSMGG